MELLETGRTCLSLNLTNRFGVFKQVLRDLDVKQTVKLAGGRPTTALAVQRAYLKAAQTFMPPMAAQPPHRMCWSVGMMY